MKILSIDPALTDTGFAAVDTEEDRRDLWHHVPRGNTLPQRLNDLSEHVIAKITDLFWDHVLVEVLFQYSPGMANYKTGPDGHCHRIHRGARDIVYGMALGVVIAACQQFVPNQVKYIPVQDWTRLGGRRPVSKEKRIRSLILEYPELQGLNHNCLDAYRMLLWWQREQTLPHSSWAIATSSRNRSNAKPRLSKKALSAMKDWPKKR